MKRWSKLQKRLYLIVDPAAKFQIHCARYKMGQYGSTELTRYWITVGKEIIFDYPKQFAVKFHGYNNPEYATYPYLTDMSAISELIREYIDTPVAELRSKRFENDYWALADILRAADRRIGRKHLEELRLRTDDPAVLSVIGARLSARSSDKSLC